MTFPATADQQILVGVAATLKVVLTDADGSPADAAGALTVGVTKSDGTVVLAAGTATTHGTTGAYSVALVPAKNTTLELLVATWTDAGDGSVVSTLIEVVGGYFFSLADARASDPTLADTVKYLDATILATRADVEEECELICDVAFVPRCRRVTLDGTGTRELILPDNRIRRVRTVRIYSNVGAGTYTALDATALASLVLDDDNRIERTDLGTFTEGRSNIVVEYEHGYDRAPTRLRGASLGRLRHLLNATKTGIPDRATTYRSADGGTYQLAQPGAYKTGIPDVDAVYSRYSLRQDDDNRVPASRALEFDPSFFGVFHGGRR